MGGAVPMLRVRVVRSDWHDDPRHPSPGHNPVPPYATWHDPPGDWFLDIPSIEWLVKQGQRDLVDYTIRASLAGEAPELVVTPWADVREMLGAERMRAARPR